MSRRFLVAVVLFALGCAAPNRALDRARGMFLRGDYEAAGDLLESNLPQAGRNRLLYLLEAGSCYHYARTPQRARSCWERADELARVNSYVSVSEEGAALVFDDRLRPYRAPSYERFLLLFMLAVEHFTAGEIEKALVELNRIIEYQKDLQQSDRASSRPVVHYLAGLCRMRFGEYDSAAFEFRRAAELRLEPRFQAAAREAERAAESAPASLPHGWLLAFVETGLAPHKVPASALTAIPRFVPTWSPFNGVVPRLTVDGRRFSPLSVVDVAAEARKWLDKRLAGYLAREVGSVLAKKLIANGIGELLDSKDAEKAAFAALLLSRSPDLRSWRNLPERISVFCVPLAPGNHVFTLSFGGCRGYNHGEVRLGFDIESGKITTVHCARLK